MNFLDDYRYRNIYRSDNIAIYQPFSIDHPPWFVYVIAYDDELYISDLSYEYNKILLFSPLPYYFKKNRISKQLNLVLKSITKDLTENLSRENNLKKDVLEAGLCFIACENDSYLLGFYAIVIEEIEEDIFKKVIHKLIIASTKGQAEIDKNY